MSHFEIERSLDGRSFSLIQKVTAKGGQHDNSYVTEDRNAPSGVVYYRLRSVDIDGRASYSKIVSVKMHESLQATITPNPFTERIVVSVVVPVRTEIAVRIFDNTGRQVYIQRVNGEQGKNKISCDGLQSLTPGIYMVKIQSGSDTVEKKILKAGK